MLIVPVIDLCNGQVVHAQRGDRARYRPLRSRLCASAEPVAVVDALSSLGDFPVLYVADLDAISGTGSNAQHIAEIQCRHTHLSIWVDAGIGDTASWEQFRTQRLGRPVVGSETLRDIRLLEHVTYRGGFVLSLDFTDDQFLGPERLLSEPALWPDQVIVMCLARVGSRSGPDWLRLDQVRARNPATQLFAAGGIRDAADLSALAAWGASGVLVATALHEGRIEIAGSGFRFGPTPSGDPGVVP